jgi:hypothetical protein
VTDPCATGIHACALAALPYWLDEELWEIELAGPVEQTAKKLVAPRGRLLRRIEAWDDAAKAEFVLACKARIAARTDAGAAFAGDVSATTLPASAAFVAARAAEVGGGPEAYDAERAWQSAWLADRLGLA